VVYFATLCIKTNLQINKGVRELKEVFGGMYVLQQSISPKMDVARTLGVYGTIPKCVLWEKLNREKVQANHSLYFLFEF
jgi:hypothetical protein